LSVRVRHKKKLCDIAAKSIEDRILV